ncbi:MAG: SGNH/GDSL hydrolase family protein [Myxococcota bacterium]
MPYNPGYYVAVRGTSQEVEYPYGIIKINRDGFADVEADLSHPRQVGYFGDSVTYGVGAGYGYRFSDLLREAYPDVDHLNLGGIGLSVSKDTIDRSLELAERYGLDTAVYFLNLNDIVPDATVAPQQQNAVVEDAPWTRRTLVWLAGHADWLRERATSTPPCARSRRTSSRPAAWAFTATRPSSSSPRPSARWCSRPRSASSSSTTSSRPTASS